MPEPSNNFDATSGRDVRAPQSHDAATRIPSPADFASVLNARLQMLGVPPRAQLGPRAGQAFDALVTRLSAEAGTGQSMADAAISRALTEVATLARREAVLERAPSPSLSGPQIVDPRTFDVRPSGPDSMMLAGAYPPALKQLLRELGVDPKRVSPEMAQAIVEMASRRTGCDLQDPECWRALASELIDAMPAGDKPDGDSPAKRRPLVRGDQHESPPIGQGSSADYDLPSSLSSAPRSSSPASASPSSPSYPSSSSSRISPPPRSASPAGSVGAGHEARPVMAMSRRHDPEANVRDVMTPLFQEAGLTSRGAQRQALQRLRRLVRTARHTEPGGAARTPASIQLHLIKELLTSNASVRTSPRSSSDSPSSDPLGAPGSDALASLLGRLETVAAGSSMAPDTLEPLAGRAIAEAIMPGRPLTDASLRRLARLVTGMVLGRPMPSQPSSPESAGRTLPPDLGASLAEGRIDEASQQLFARALEGASAKKGIEAHKLDPALVQKKATDAFSQILATKPNDRLSLASSALDWLRSSGVDGNDLVPEEASLAQIRDHLPELDAQIAVLEGSLHQQDAQLARLGERAGVTAQRIENARATNDPALDSLTSKLSALEEAGRSAMGERQVLADGLEASERTRHEMTSSLDRLLDHVLGKVVDHAVSPEAVHEASAQIAGPYLDELGRLLDREGGSDRARGPNDSAKTSTSPASNSSAARAETQSASARTTSGSNQTKVPGLPDPKETLAQERVRVCNAILHDSSLSMVDKILLFVLTYAAYAGAEHERHLRELAEIDKKEADWEALHQQLSSRSDALEKQRDVAEGSLNRARSAYEDAARANGGHEGSPAVEEARRRVEAAERKLATVDKLRVEVNQKEQEVLQNKPKEPRDLILTKMQRISQLREMMLKMGNDFLEEEKRLLERINRF